MSKQMDVATKGLQELVRYQFDLVNRLSAGIRAVRGLMNESVGVAGLHRNGDVATWAELEDGGRFGEWLAEFNEAERLIDLSAPTATEDARCSTTSKTTPSA